MMALSSLDAFTVEDTVALLRENSWTERNENDEEGRTVIHCRLGGIGADWDLGAAIALAEDSTWRGFVPSLLAHNLGIEDEKGRVYCFEVRLPKQVAS